ncbi:MAG TPA: hypothetical protein VFX12_14930 [Vicinamibacterales bacterium]|nr:hypothetical protein [Vicinamibacterales bacterium]
MPAHRKPRRSQATAHVRPGTPPRPRERPFWRTHAWLLLLVALVLWGTTDDREVGLIADGRQMIFTAVAVSETGSLGQARDRDLTVRRPEGDSVSRYGLGMSFAQVPAAALAPAVERRLGAGSSQPLFLIAPWCFLFAAALLAGMAARELGAGLAGQQFAILLATLASPLGSYVGTALSEPLQAAALIGAFTSALIARRTSRPGAAVMAGACVGIAILTKSSLAVVAPLTLLPMVTPTPRRRRLLALAGGGLLPIVAVWLWFEVARFGRPFASYAGEGFTHPFVDGLWRLLAGPDKGLLLYFPALAVAVVAGTRTWRDRAARESALGALLPFVALLALAAPWWAWHGVDGWGPRLLVPAVPLLGALAAVEIARWPRPAAYVLVAASIAINLPPLLQNPTPVVRYMWQCAWPSDPAIALRVPRFARRDQDGRTLVPPDQVLATVPSASPFVVLPWFWNASRGNPPAIAAQLQRPPWSSARPDIVPVPPLSPAEAEKIARPPRWNFWGRGFAPAARPFAVYDSALADQVIRAQELRRTDVALRLARKYLDLAPSGFADALLLECYRLLRRRADAVAWLTSLPTERRLEPAINVVLALWDRDDGKEEQARALLRSAAAAYPNSPLQSALDAPLSAWPSDFGSMTSNAGALPVAR